MLEIKMKNKSLSKNSLHIEIKKTQNQKEIQQDLMLLINFMKTKRFPNKEMLKVETDNQQRLQLKEDHIRIAKIKREFQNNEKSLIKKLIIRLFLENLQIKIVQSKIHFWLKITKKVLRIAKEKIWLIESYKQITLR
jgi:hypothetical protein